MLTTPIYRYTKPGVRDSASLLPSVVLPHKTVLFSDRTVLSPRNKGSFDVLTQSGRVLDKGKDIEGDFYWSEDGNLVVKEVGFYMVRLFDEDPSKGDAATINLGKLIVFSDGDMFKVGVPFWPDVLSQPEGGVARVASNGKDISVCCPPGMYSVSYRLRNYLGQVSEPACLMLTIV